MQGTYVIGATSAITAVLAIVVISYFGRRPIYIYGQFLMALFLFICGLSVLNQWNMTSFIMINFSIAAFQMSQGSITWLYIPEVTVDAASGFSAGA